MDGIDKAHGGAPGAQATEIMLEGIERTMHAPVEFL